MIALIGGIAILGGLLLLIYLFVSADPRRLARDLEWAAVALGIVLLVAICVSERFILLWLPLPLLAYPALLRLHARRWSWQSAKPEAATRFLRVTRDPRNEGASGTVLRGTFAGSRLDELARDELILLLKEARIDDPEGSGLIEDYLDNTQPDWRDDLAHGEDGEPDMSLQEARDILGVDPGADEVAITHAYRRLRRRLQSDATGSDYFVDKINRARDVLLKQR